MVGANIVRQFRSPTQLREKSKPWNSSERAVEGASPYNLEFVVNSEHGRTLFAPTVIWASPTSAKSLRSLRIYIALRARKAVQIFFLRYHFYLISYFYLLLILQSAPCRLAPNEALPHTPLGALPPDPHNGFHPLTLTRDVSLDLLLASLGALFYFMLAIYFGLLCSFLISHSSFLIPHSSLLT